MGEALRHAHDNGIIHADFSPKNVFLTERGEAKVLDFGIARAIAVADAKVAASEGTVFDPASLGGLTPGYASFEQLTGKEPVAADDVFALGCVVYQLLCGDHPNNGKTAVQAVALQIRPRRIHKLPGKKWRALQKAMALLSEERYVSVGEFLDDFAPRANPATRPIAIATGVVLVIIAASVYQAFTTYRDKQAHTAELLVQKKALATSKELLEQEQALTSQQSARELERINSEYLTLAEVLIAGNQHDEAEKYLEKVRESTPGHTGLSTLQKQLTESRRAYHERMASQENARIEINRLLDKTEPDIAAGYLVRPPGDSAYSAYQQIIALEPDNVQARTVLRRLVQLHLDGVDRALRLGDLQDATVWLDDLAMIAPDNRDLSRLRSELEQAAAQERQRNSRIQSLLVQASGLQGEGSALQRRDIYLQILEIEPLNREAAKGLERARLELAQQERRLQEQAQKDAAALLQHAIQLLNKQPIEPAHYQQAHQYLLEAQRKNPGSTEVVGLIEQMPQRYIRTIEDKMAAKEYDEALKFVQAAIVLAPQNTRLLQLRMELEGLDKEQKELILPSYF
jgi:serine/threonine protein kinase